MAAPAHPFHSQEMASLHKKLNKALDMKDAMSPRDELLEEFTEARELEREIERAARHGDAAKAFRMVEVEDAILKAARRPMTTDRQPFRSAPGEDRVWTEELDRIFREVELRN